MAPESNGRPPSRPLVGMDDGVEDVELAAASKPKGTPTKNGRKKRKDRLLEDENLSIAKPVVE